MKWRKTTLVGIGMIAAVLAAGPAAAGKKSGLLPVTGNTIGGPAKVSVGPGIGSIWRTFGSATADICVTMLNESRRSTAFIMLSKGGQFEVPPGETRTSCSSGEGFFIPTCESGSVCTVQWRVDLM